MGRNWAFPIRLLLNIFEYFGIPTPQEEKGSIDFAHLLHWGSVAIEQTALLVVKFGIVR